MIIKREHESYGGGGGEKNKLKSLPIGHKNVTVTDVFFLSKIL